MDSDSERKLRELRLNLAEVCLEGRVERIASLCRNPAGDALMTMINSGVRHLPMTKTDQAVAERCHRILSVEHDVARKVAAYLALSLFSFPHSIERAFDLVDVPTPLLATVVKVLLAVPLFFTRDGARRRALAHVEAAVQEIHKAVSVIDEPDFRKEVLNGFMDGYNITAVYSEDVPLRALAQRRAELIRLYLEINDLVRDAALQPRRENEPVVRMGILCPGPMSETAALRGHLVGLDRDIFQIIAFVPDEAATTVSAGFEDLADDFIALPVGDITHAAEIIAGEKLDILMVGANITNTCRFPWTLLMAQRLAHLQVAMHSCSLTSGFSTIDLFLNGDLNEPEDARDDYTEELGLISGSSKHYVFSGPEI
jgi:predicted O-linked N-acetylglucosamine transferase (SPINDLY family)